MNWFKHTVSITRHGVSWRERRNVIQGFKRNSVDRQERRDRGTKRLKESSRREMPVSFEDPVQLRTACGQLRQNLVTMSVTVNPVYGKKKKILVTLFYTRVFCTHHTQNNIYWQQGNSQPRLGRCYFQHIFTQWFWNVIYASVNKQPISFQNSFGVLSRLRQKKGLKGVF